MAGIKASIELGDGVTPILKRINKRFYNLEKQVKQVIASFDSLNFAIKEIPASQEKIILQQGRIKRSIDNTQAAEYRCVRAENLMEQSITGVAIKQQQLTQNVHKTWQAQEKTKQSIEKTSQAQEKSKQAAESTKQATIKTAAAEDARAAKNLQYEIKLGKLSDDRVYNSLRLEEKLGGDRDKRAANALKYEVQVGEAEDKRAAKALEHEERLGIIQDRRASKELENQVSVGMAEDKRLAKAAELEVRLGQVEDNRAANARKNEINLAALEESHANKAARNEQKLQQEVNKTTKSRFDSIKAFFGIRTAQGKVLEQEQKTLRVSQQIDTEKKRGLLIIAKEALVQKKIEYQTIRNKQAQEKYNQSVLKGANNHNQVWAALKRGTSAYLGVQSAKGIINTADSLTMTKARLDVMSDGKTSTDELMNMIYGASMRSRSGYLDMAASVSKLGIQAGNLFQSDGKQNNAAIVRFMENYNKMAVISGSTAQQTSAAMLQITQALSSGELRGDELRSVMENMPVVAQYVAKQLTSMDKGFFDKLPGKLKYIAKDGKVAADEILELGHNGLISAQTLRDAVLNATEDLNEKIKKMPYAWEQVWTIFKNAALKAFQPILNGISAILKNEKFLEFANALGRALVVAGRVAVPVFNALGTAIGWVYDKVKGVYNFVSGNFGWIAPLILGIAAALGVMYIAINAVAWATTIANTASKMWTATQAAFNAVMAMNPVAWVIIAIIALIAVIYIVIAVINKCADTSISATGIVAAMFTALGVHIWNTISLVWNHISSFVEFYVNVWSEPMYSVKKLFVNLASNVLDLFIAMTKGCDEFATNFANAILDAINVVLDGWNWFVDKLGVVGEKLGLGKATHFTARTSITSDIENVKAGLEKLAGDKPEGYWEAPKLSKMGSQEILNAYKWGDNLSKKVEGFFDFSKYTNGTDLNDFYKALTGGFNNDATNSATGNPTLDKISNDTGDIAKNTGKSEEDFSYLRELAEREAINKYTLTDLKIDMTNNNNISNGVDSDNLMQRLAKQLSEAVLSTAEGITPW